MLTFFKKIFSVSAQSVALPPSIADGPTTDADPENLVKRPLTTDGSNIRKQGNASLAQGNLEDAKRCYLAAVAIDPNDIDGHVNLGYVLTQQKKYDEAAHHLQQVLKIDPSNVDSMFMLGILFQDLHKEDEARQYFTTVLTLTQDYEIVYRTLLSLKRYEDAIVSCDRILANQPDYAGAHVNRGIALQALDRHEEAREQYVHAMALGSNTSATWLNYGVALKNLRCPEEELAAYDQALRIQPDLAEAHFNASFCRLQLGDFERGWEEHEWRWNTPQLARARRHFAQPLWLGKESLQGKTILLHAEQGLGDTLQFCRYAKIVKDKGANVLLLVQPALKLLLTGLDGTAMVIADGEELPPFDFHCPLLSLPLACNTTLTSMQSRSPYIHVESNYVEKWRSRLGARDGVRIGVVWSGNARHVNDRNRSIPLASFRKLQSEQVKLISLQNEVRQSDATTLSGPAGITHFGSALQDFTDTAGLIMNLDLVIAVDTSVAHLAAALGRPVWILLPFLADWRWMHDRSDSPWYPTATLFRQTKAGNWDDVFAAVSERLHATVCRSANLKDEFLP